MALTAESQAVVEALRQRDPALIDLPLEQARAEYVVNMREAAGAAPEMDSVADHPIELAGRTLALRLYRPRGVAPAAAPAVVYFHGGGWVFGNLDSHDSVCRQLAQRTGCVLLAVDYRLGPEHPLPAASDDAIDAFDWIVAQAEELGVDPTRLAVAGDSAGGHLSAVVALAARDRGVALRAQVLIYPAVDMRARAGAYPSKRRNSDYPPLTRELMHFFSERALTDNTLLEDWRISPLMADDLSGLAPALVITAGADILMDEGILYRHWLEESGTEAEHAHYPGTIHGFIQMLAYLSATDHAMNRIAGMLRTRLRI